MFTSIYLKSSNILYLGILQKPFIVISACKTQCTVPHHNSMYKCLPEDEPSVSKCVEDIKKIKNWSMNLEKVH
jgi:hypothetical protein